METDLQTELVQENPIITRSNEMDAITRQHEDPSSTNASDVTSSNCTPVVATDSNIARPSDLEEQECATDTTRTFKLI